VINVISHNLVHKSVQDNKYYVGHMHHQGIVEVG